MKFNLSGKAAALFVSAFMAVTFSACGETENTSVEQSEADETTAVTTTEEAAEETSATTTVETTAETTTEVTTTAETTAETTSATSAAATEKAAENTQEQKNEENKSNDNNNNNSGGGAPAKYSDDRYQPFIDGLENTMRNYYDAYGGPDNTDIESVNIIVENHNGFSYTFTDINGDGKCELMIGCETTDSNGHNEYPLLGFVTITNEGNYKIIASGHTRDNISYIGGGYFYKDGSGGADLHISSVCHFDAASNTLVTDAQFITDYDEATDGSGIPKARYTIYEGTEWSYSVSDRAIEDPDALHDSEAQNKWNDYLSRAYSENSKIAGADWIRVQCN